MKTISPKKLELMHIYSNFEEWIRHQIVFTHNRLFTYQQHYYGMSSYDWTLNSCLTVKVVLHLTQYFPCIEDLAILDAMNISPEIWKEIEPEKIFSIPQSDLETMLQNTITLKEKLEKLLKR